MKASLSRPGRSAAAKRKFLCTGKSPVCPPTMPPVMLCSPRGPKAPFSMKPAADQLTTWDWSELEPGLEGTGEYPPSLADTNIADRVVTWIRLRVDKDPTVRTTLSWLGINATMVEQRVTVTGEIVGTGQA